MLRVWWADGNGDQSRPNSAAPANTWWNAISLSSAVSTVIFVGVTTLLRCGLHSQGLLGRLFSVQSECWFVVTIRFTRSWLLFCFEFFFEILSLPAATLSRTRNINWKIVIGRNINHKTHERQTQTNETHFHSKGRAADHQHTLGGNFLGSTCSWLPFKWTDMRCWYSSGTRYNRS